MEMLNPSMEGECCFNISSGRGSKFHPPTNNIKGFNISTNNNIRIFRHVSLHERLNSTKKHDLNKKWATFFYEVTSPSTSCDTQHS